MQTKSPDDATGTQQFNYAMAMTRLIYVVALGCLLILAFGLRDADKGITTYFGVVCVGLMAGGAALLSGGLLGFLFGVPHTRAAEPSQTNEETSEGLAKRANTRRPSTSYRPNTGLEQISDWLTKMLVGVGLIEIKVIPGKLTAVAGYLANSLGDRSDAFAMAILIYFSVCGFVFGFLWARLYLPRWFREADEVQILVEKVSRLEEQQQADARALLLINRLLNRDATDDTRISDQEVMAAIKASSESVKSQIFTLAKKALENRNADDYEGKVQGAISTFRGLIACDTNNLYHQYHGELSTALYRKPMPDLQESEKEITKAIEIRDRLGKGGWEYYEFHRARCRVKQDPNLETGHSDTGVREGIIADLKVAHSRADKWQRWYKSEPKIEQWMRKNDIGMAELGES
jgi:hypothetical protein